MSDDKNIVDRLHGACVGHSFTKVRWPHRLLHAVTTIRIAAEAAGYEIRKVTP